MFPFTPTCRTSRRTIQRAQRRKQKKQTLQKQKILQHISTIANTAAVKRCQTTFGFASDPSHSKIKNFNHAIRNIKDSLIKNQPTNLAYHNLCTTTQPPVNANRLLGLNLKYCISASSPKPNLKHTIGKLVKAVRTQHLLTTKKPASKDYIKQIYKPNPYYKPPPASGELEYYLHSFTSKLETAIENSAKKKHNGNLTKEQTTILHQLKNNPDFIIMPSDKNLGPAIMNRTAYIDKVLTEHLLTDSYEFLPTETAAKKLKTNRNYLLHLYRNNKEHLTKAEQDYFERSFTETHRTPLFYLIPKVQKQPIKFRPVVSCCGSFNAVFSTWLDFSMKKLLKCIPSYLRDSSHILQELNNLPPLPPNARIFTADATAMYTNIDTDIAIAAFTFLLENYADEIPHDFPKTFFLQVLRFIMENNIFQFDNTYWIQLSGTAMGTPAACTYATIAFGILERHSILPRFCKSLPFYKRFIDDVFGIWIPTTTNDEAEWKAFQQAMNQFGKLRWVVSTRETTANFLDLTITLQHGKFITSTFQKPMNLHLYIPSLSAHPESCLKGLVVGNFLRFQKQNTPENFQTLLQNFAIHLHARGHSFETIKFQFTRAAKILDKKRLLKLPTQANQTLSCNQTFSNENHDDSIDIPLQSRPTKTLYIHWQYQPNGVKKETIRAIYNETLQGHDNFDAGMTIALSRPTNLRDLLTKTRLQQPPGKNASDHLATILQSRSTC